MLGPSPFPDRASELSLLPYLMATIGYSSQIRRGLQRLLPRPSRLLVAGSHREEAQANIQAAIREYVQAAEELARDSDSRVVEVAVA